MIINVPMWKANAIIAICLCVDRKRNKGGSSSSKTPVPKLKKENIQGHCVNHFPKGVPKSSVSVNILSPVKNQEKPPWMTFDKPA